MPLSSKSALVLGASRGLGRAMALALAQQGTRVILPYYDWPESVAEMKDIFQQAGHDYLALEVDLRQEEQVREMVARISDYAGGLDILINNIERGGMPVVHGPYTPQQWEREMATTLQAKWLVFHHSLPLLRHQPTAQVINISSIAGLVGRTGSAGLLFNDGYAAANRAVSSFTETWAREAAPTVRVNEIMLGFFDQRHGRQTRGWELLSPLEQQEVINHTLLGRTGNNDDLIKAMFFLLNDAPFMTGSCLRLDGGYVLGRDTVPPMPKGLDEDLAIKR